MNPMKLIMLFFLAFSTILAQYRTIDMSNLQSSYSGEGGNNFEINFEDYDRTPNYYHFIIKPSSDGRPSALLSFSDNTCTNGRTQMSFQPYGNLNLFIKKEEIRYKRKGYLCFVCIKGNFCKFDFEVKKENIANLEFGSYFKYNVNSGNNMMKFNFTLKDGEKIEDGTQIQMWVKGEKIQTTDIYPIQMRDVEFDHGKAFYGTYETKSNYILTIVAEEGDYISIGSNFVENGISKSKMNINEAETIGNLNYGLNEICYNVDFKSIFNGKIYLDGIVFKNQLQFYILLENKEKQMKTNITDGLLNHVIPKEISEKAKSICFSYLEEADKRKEIVFSFILINYNSKSYGDLIYPPQIPGYIYRHKLYVGESALFQGMITSREATEINYNMKSIIGFPNMKFIKCKTYPKCSVNSGDIEDPHHSNRMTVKSFYLKDEQTITTISSFQPLMLVECTSSREGSDDKTCTFETSVFTNKDRLILKEFDTFSQYLLEYESDLYSIDFTTEDEKDKIYLDLIIFSGDVSLEMESNVNANKYYLANKIFYSIHLSESSLRKKVINFKVTAYTKSFYMVQYQMVKEGSEKSLINRIESGVNYLESVSIGEYGSYEKYIEFDNFLKDRKMPFLLNFYSLNCKFYVQRFINENNTIDIEMIDNYGQDIIDPNDEFYQKTPYKYYVIVNQKDITEYNKQNCMLYVSGLEIERDKREYGRGISIPENVPQFYNFTDQYPVIYYVFHIADRDNIVIVNLNLIDKAKFTAKLYIGHNSNEAITKEISRNGQIIIDRDKLKKCEEDEVCQLNIELRLNEQKSFKRVETTVFQIKSAPIYLQKNVMNNDILVNDQYKHFYFDIGKEEYGDIKIDFIRGSGNIYATVVNKTGINESSIKKEWRGKYDFPYDFYNSLQYETYLRKIIISPMDTQNCDDGCYVLITVKSTTNPELPEEYKAENITLSKMTITPRINPRTIEEASDLPAIKMKVNEFVIGNIYRSSDEIYEYYDLFLPYDSNQITIDWQAEGCYLYIKIGEEKPNTNNSYDFVFKDLGYKTVHVLTKQEILQKLPDDQRRNTLKHLRLTLGVYTQNVDTLYTTMYAFRISQPLQSSSLNPSSEEKLAMNIIHIRSDQKVQCKPIQNGNYYECLFAVIFDFGDIGKSLLVYPKGENENVLVDFYAQMVNSDSIEKNIIYDITNVIPKEGAEFNSKKGKRYIFIEKIEDKKSLIIRTKTQIDINTEVLTSVIGDETTVKPNPSTPQVYALGLKKGKNELRFNFATTKNLLINIAGIDGEGYFQWDEELDSNRTYYIYGYEDRLTLTSYTSLDEYKLSTLIVKSVEFSFHEDSERRFVFYMTFYPRSQTFNLDQLKEGRSTEFNYREIKFPINFYSPISSDFIGASFNFYNLEYKGKSTVSSDKPMLTIWGKIVDKDLVAESKMTSTPMINDTDAIRGVFDGAFGSIVLNKGDIEKFNVEQNKRVFYVSIEINKELTLDFNTANIEVSILKKLQSEESQLYTAEHVYHNGKLTKDNTEYRFKLKTNEHNPYMAVEFASNSDIIKYAIGPCQDYKSNLMFKYEEYEVKKKNGKSVISFKVSDDILKGNNTLFLNVYVPEDKNIDSKLGNYIIKYMNSKVKNYFDFFTIDYDKVKYEIIQRHEGGIQDYKLTFATISNFKVNYFIKLVYQDNLIEDEEKYTIAMSESEGKYIQINDNEMVQSKNTTLVISGVNKQVAYIKLLAKVNLDSLTEYMLYQPVEIGSAEKEPKGDSFALLETDELQSLEYNKEKRQVIGNVTKAKKIQKYLLNFKDENDKPEYIKIETISLYNRSQIIYFSPTDPNGRDNRLQLGQSDNGTSTFIWVKKEQILDKDNKLYIAVECQEENCGYQIKFSGYNSAQFETSSFTFTYYVSKNNKQMLFRIKNDLNIFAMFGEAITVYTRGNYYSYIEIKDCLNETCEARTFIGGSAITTDLPKHNYIDVIVEAEEGDLITFGSKVTFKEGLSFSNELLPNTYPLTGYLAKNILEKECYKLPHAQLSEMYYYLSISLNLEKGGIYFLDENLEILEASKRLILDGYYTTQFVPPSDDRYLCLYIPNDTDSYTFRNFSYTIQLTEPKQMKQKGLYNIFPPLTSGLIYPRITPAGSSVFFNSVYNTLPGQEVIFNMLTITGTPKMYMYKCKNYPLCDVDYNKINQTEGIIKIDEINRMNTWHYNNTINTTPISPEQIVMVVQCMDLNQDLNDVCKFQTSIYGNNETIYLIERQPFSQYIIKNEIEGFYLEFSGRKKVQRILVDILIISGDISVEFFDFHEKKQFEAHKYYVGNKIFYSVSVAEIEVPIVYILMKARLNSYYIIEYRVVTDQSEQLVNKIYSGANYLVPIPITTESNYKEIDIQNRNLLKNSFYLVSFQALNCKFNVYQKISEEETETIQSYGRFAQKLYKNTDENFESQDHTYRIETTNIQKISEKNNFCILYASGLEIPENKDVERSLLLGEAIPQKIRFDDTLKKIKYVYPLMNNTKNSAVDLKMSSHALFNLTIFINGNYYEYQTFSRDIVYFLHYDDLKDKCKENEICHLVFQIEFIESYSKDVYPILETMIRQTRNIPYYLTKDVAKRDFVSGDVKLYLYTDIGQYEEGYITANFMRGNGNLYAKIVPIGEVSNNTEPDWRNYTFPKNMTDSLKYNFNEKKIVFDLFDTAKCQDGCYLLITLQNSVLSSYSEETRLYHLTLTVHVDKIGEEYIDGPSIAIEPEQYIIGSFNDFTRMEEKKMYDYYEITIPYDVSTIEIEWQSTTPRLLINKGTTLPKLDKADFIFPASRGDTILRLDKKNITQDSSLANTVLTLGIYGEDIETIYGTKYSFLVHLNNQLNIHKIAQDQKTLCQPEKVDNEYRCLFMVTYEYLQFFNDVMLFARSQSNSASIKLYGNFVDKGAYEKGKESELKELIPSKGKSIFNNKADKDFIYAVFGEEHKNLFVSVYTSENSIIEFMSSFRTFDQVVTPNPTGCQIFSMSANEESILFHIPTRKGLFVNFVSIYGSGKINIISDYNTTYAIRGRDDRLSFAIPQSDEESTVFAIENVNFNKTKPSSEDEDEPGFAFYIEYNLRGYDNVNFDELSFGKTTEISYFKTTFPFYYYAKLDKFDSSVFAVYTFHDVEYNKTEDITREIRTEEFELESTLVEQKKIYPAINDYQKIPQPHQPFRFDYYDPAILTGQLNYFKIAENEIVPDKDFPTFLFSLKQFKNGTDKVNYNRLRIEMTLFKENDNSVTTEKLYQYGILFFQNSLNYYKLKVDGKEGFMRIEFSPGTEFIDIAISDKLNSTNNMTGLNIKSEKCENGKCIITFAKPSFEYIYLNIFFKKSAPRDVLLLLNSYVFKYINSPKIEEFKEYKTKSGNRNLNIRENGKNGEYINSIDVSFSPINVPINENTTVIYSLKIAETLSTDIQGERFDSIALKYYFGVVKRAVGKSDDTNINIQVQNIDKGYHYAQVIAQIKEGTIIEYYAYEPIYNPNTKNKLQPGERTDSSDSDKDKERKSNDDDNSVYVVVGISIVLLAIVIVLVIVIMTFNSKNKNLMNQVQQISFVGNDANRPSNDNNGVINDDNGAINDDNNNNQVNLLMDSNNELE